MNKILVININWLGDAIFSTPVFRALKAAYPKARVACLCVPRVEEVLRHCPDIDEIIIYDERGRDRWPWKKLQLVWRLRQASYDIAFILHRSMTRALLAYLAGIKQRVGYSKAPALLTQPVPGGSQDMHRSDQYLRVIESFGVPVIDRRCRLNVSGIDFQRVQEQLQARGIAPGQKYVVLNTGGNWDLKRWPLKCWAQLARQFNHAGIPIVFSGSSKDSSDAARIIDQAGIEAVNMAGQTSLGEALGLYKRACVVISADSGPLHLAAAVGASVIGIFGPTRPEVTGPLGGGQAVVLFKEVGCNKAPCYHLACSNNVCMQAIEAQDVWEAAQKLIR